MKHALCAMQSPQQGRDTSRRQNSGCSSKPSLRCAMLSHFSHVWPCGLQHARLSCPSLSPGICSNSCPLNQWCHPTISSSVAPSPPGFYLSLPQGIFQWVSSSHQVAKVLEFKLSISPSNEYSGLISFRIDWFDLSAVQGTLKSLQHHIATREAPNK